VPGVQIVRWDRWCINRLDCPLIQAAQVEREFTSITDRDTIRLGVITNTPRCTASAFLKQQNEAGGIDIGAQNELTFHVPNSRGIFLLLHELWNVPL